jgi:hypothetical protein
MTTVDSLGRILAQLGQVRLRCPELRFGQMLATIGMLAEDETGHSLWDVEDADFALALERFASDMARRELNRAAQIAAPDGGDIVSLTASPLLPRTGGRG